MLFITRKIIKVEKISTKKENLVFRIYVTQIKKNCRGHKYCDMRNKY